MNKSILLISFSLLCCVAKSQTTQSSEINNSNQQLDRSVARTPMTQSSNLYFPAADDYNDAYMGHGNEYAHIFVSKQIPSDFPKYTRSLTADDYKQLVNSYCKLNSQLIEEKFRSKYAK